MILLGLEEFASKRRGAQDELIGHLTPYVDKALDGNQNTHGYGELLAEVASLWRRYYAEEAGEERSIPASLRDSIARTLRLTERAGSDKTTTNTVATWLAGVILNSSVEEAAKDDPEDVFLEWVTMHDGAVRPSHQVASGQVRPIGEPFDVDGVKMRRPGDTSAPIEEWINCRCVVRPVLAAEAVAAGIRAKIHGATWEEVTEPFGGAQGFLDLFDRTDVTWAKPYAEMLETFREVSREEREKDAKEGRALPDGSFPIDNCEDLANAIQAIGRAKDPAKAKAHIRKRKNALGCPDVELPDTWGGWVAPSEEIKRKKKTRNELGMFAPDGAPLLTKPQGEEPLEEPTHAGLAVQAHDTGRIVLIQRALDPEDPPEVQGTWEFPGGSIDEGETPEEAARREFAEEVGCPVPDGEITNGWRSPDGIYQGFVLTVDIEAEAFEKLNPDEANTPNPDDPNRDRPEVSAWFTVEQMANLGPALRPEINEMDWSVFEQEDKMPEEEDEAMTASVSFEEWAANTEVDEEREPHPPDDSTLEFHMVIAPEGVWSGDGRRFAEGSLSHRPLPIPHTWQKISAPGHEGNVVVGKTERIGRKDGELRGAGRFILNQEAGEYVGLIGEFGRFGISVDGDMVVLSQEESEEGVTFTKARASASCGVAIPAFAEAWIKLGPPPEGFLPDEGLEEAEDDAEMDESLVASVAPVLGYGTAFDGDSLTAADVAPGRTEDGPGWLTHPVDTDRLRDYWTQGPGAAEIAWGTDGDFNRCRLAVAQYVKPQYLAGYCANRHYDALGYWPGQHAGGTTAMQNATVVNGTPAEALSLVASYGMKAPHEWFTMPEPDCPTPFTITEEGQVYGHVAQWGVCHLRWQDKKCVEPPKSPSNYAYFLLGEVLTTEGAVPCGSLTIGGGHADEHMTMRQAMAHYDDTATVFADVHAMDGEHGIWVCGWVRPGTPEEMVIAARASKPSGDWRRAPKGLDFIGAHSVNSPGFPIPRVAAAQDAFGPLSLVAANPVLEDETERFDNQIDYGVIARMVAEELAFQEQQKTEAKARMLALAAEEI